MKKFAIVLGYDETKARKSDGASFREFRFVTIAADGSVSDKPQNFILHGNAIKQCDALGFLDVVELTLFSENEFAKPDITNIDANFGTYGKAVLNPPKAAK